MSLGVLRECTRMLAVVMSLNAIAGRSLPLPAMSAAMASKSWR